MLEWALVRHYPKLKHDSEPKRAQLIKTKILMNIKSKELIQIRFFLCQQQKINKYMLSSTNI